MNLFGGIEAGGTKFICAIGSSPDDMQNVTRIETTTPNETIAGIIEYFRGQDKKVKLSAIGIGSFGPLDLNIESPTYGFITSTPKNNWRNTDLLGAIKSEFNIPVGIDTDVNAAALGENEWGAAKGLTDFIYLTIGTGIGGGGMSNGNLIHGLMHTEMGHIYIPHNKVEDYFEGICPFHNDCFEGLASGPSIEKRWGIKAENLPEDHPAWELESKYIAFALANYIFTLSPQRIIIGGGIMQQKKLITLIREKVYFALNNYIQVSELTNEMDNFIVLPKLGKNAGILGAIALARNEYCKYI
jgi:fructokinase